MPLLRRRGAGAAPARRHRRRPRPADLPALPVVPEASVRPHRRPRRGGRRLTDADLARYAAELGVDGAVGEPVEAFRPAVEADYAAGGADGVRGTPTLFVNGRLYTGRAELAALRTALGLRH